MELEEFEPFVLSSGSYFDIVAVGIVNILSYFLITTCRYINNNWVYNCIMNANDGWMDGWMVGLIDERMDG